MGMGFAPTWLRQVSPRFTKPLKPLVANHLSYMLSDVKTPVPYLTLPDP